MSDAEAMADARAKFVEAFNRRDLDGMAQLVAADGISMPPNETAIVGIDAARAWWQRGFDAGTSVMQVIPRELEVRGDRAFERFDWTMDFTPASGGETTHDKGKCVWFWQREGGSWKVARAIWNSDNPVGGEWSGGSTGA